MKINYFKFIIVSLAITLFFSATYKLVYASDQQKTISNSNTQINIDLVDPVEYYSSEVDFMDITNKIVIYTAKWHYISTKTSDDVNEYTVKILDNGQHKITNVNSNGDTIIPLDGYIISIPKNEANANDLNVNDVISITGLDEIHSYEYAIENQDGVRTVITDKNVDRKDSMLVYYDHARGEFTKTSSFGAEMVVKFNYDTKQFEVASFRKPGKGDDNGVEIPRDGYVLSGSSSPYMFYLMEGLKYSIGDTIKLNGIEFTDMKAELTYKLDEVNPSVRGFNQMVIYTDDWYMKTNDGKTGTNVYGYEVAVLEDGIVSEMDTNVVIPEKGFVVSGNGESADFLRDNVEIGSVITYDKTSKTIKISNSIVNISILSLEHDLLKCEGVVAEVEEKLYDVDYDVIKENLNKAKALYNEIIAIKDSLESLSNDEDIVINTFIINHKSKEAIKLLAELYYKAMPSNVVESRAIWHRPNELTLEEIEGKLDKLKELGFNLIYVETFWNGYSNFPSEHLELHPDLVGGSYGEYGNDYLRAFISEANKRNIEVGAWSEIFFGGMKRGLPLSNILRDHPEWRMINYDGTDYQNEIIFMDPANLEFHDFLIKIFTELFTKYDDLNSFEYDFIRYPSTLGLTDPDYDPENRIYGSGYTEYAMNAFMEEKGYTGDLRQLVATDNSILNEWSVWRRDQVTNVVEKLYDAIKEVNSDVIMSMAVAPDSNYAKENYHQDWTKWIENGWIDIIEPMIYHYDKEWIESSVVEIQKITKSLAFQYAGIGPVYFGYPVVNNQDQILAANEGGAFGTAMFASHNILGNEEFENALKISTNRKDAILPHSDTNLVIKAIFDDIIDKSSRIYITNAKMTENQKEQLVTVFNEILNMPVNNAKDILEIKNKVYVVHAYSSLYASGVAIDRIQDDLDRLIRILDIKISRDLIDRDFWNPADGSERPDVYSFEYPVILDEENRDNKDNSQIFMYSGITLGALCLASGVYVFTKKKFAK